MKQQQNFELLERAIRSFWDAKEFKKVIDNFKHTPLRERPHAIVDTSQYCAICELLNTEKPVLFNQAIAERKSIKKIINQKRIENYNAILDMLTNDNGFPKIFIGTQPPQLTKIALPELALSQT